MSISKRPASFIAALFLLFIVAALLVAPAIIRGTGARAWVDHYASLDSLPRPRRAAVRALLEKTDLAIRNLAPLPMASATAMRALEIGERTERQDHDPETALMIFRGVRTSCALVQSRPLQGVGFAVIEARAAALEGAVEPRDAKVR